MQPQVIATKFDDAGKSDHREVPAGPCMCYKIKALSRLGTYEALLFSTNKLDHYCMSYINLGP